MTDWKTWLYGLVSAMIGAAANTVTVMIVFPRPSTSMKVSGRL